MWGSLTDFTDFTDYFDSGNADKLVIISLSEAACSVNNICVICEICVRLYLSASPGLVLERYGRGDYSVFGDEDLPNRLKIPARMVPEME